MKALVYTSVVSIFLAISFVIGLWTERSLEFWLTYFKTSPVDVPLWLAWLLSIVLNGVIVVLNIVSELLRLVV